MQSLWCHRVSLTFAAASILLLSCAGQDPDTAPTAVRQPTPIQWSDLQGVTYDEANYVLTKTMGTAGWDAGAASVRSFQGDGGIAFDASEVGTERMVGLSRRNTDPSYTAIDYAIRLQATGVVAIYESGTQTAFSGEYQSGDQFKITRTGDAIHYYQMSAGTTVWTLLASAQTTVDPNVPLIADCSLHSEGAIVRNAKWVDRPVTSVDAIQWTKLEGLTHDEAASTLTKPGPVGWDASAASTRSFQGDGGIEFGVLETDTHRIIGLSIAGGNPRHVGINYSIYLHNSGNIALLESGTRVPHFGTYQVGDRFKITRTGDVVTYYQMPTGTTEWLALASAPSKIDANVALVAECTIYSTNGTVTNTHWVDTPEVASTQSYAIEWIYPEHAVNTTDDDSGAAILKKNGGAAWSSGAASKRRFTGDGGIAFEAIETTTHRIVGLTKKNIDASFEAIDYALQLNDAGYFDAFESGTRIELGKPYASGDKFKIARTDNVVNYYQMPVGTEQWQLVYTSAVTIEPTVALMADSSLYSVGSTVANAQWVNMPQPTYEHAVWVWNANIENDEFRDTLLERSWESGVTTLYVSPYRGENESNNFLPEEPVLTSFIAGAHRMGIRIVAAYGEANWHTRDDACKSSGWPRKRMADISEWNRRHPDNEHFDGVIIDVEPYDITRKEVGSSASLLALFRCLVDDLHKADLDAEVAIRHYWDVDVPFEGNEKPVYAHAIDLFDRTVVMAYRHTAMGDEFSSGMVDEAEFEIAYAAANGRHGALIVGVETCAECTYEPYVSLSNSGQEKLNEQLAIAGQHLRDEHGAAFRGFSIHHYGEAYLSDKNGDWPAVNSGFPMPQE